MESKKEFCMHKEFSIQEALSFGFRKTIDHFGLLLGIVLTYMGILLVAQLITGFVMVPLRMGLPDMNTNRQLGSLFYSVMPAAVFSWVILSLAKAFCNLVFFKIGLEIRDYNTATYNSFFSCMHLVLRAWGASLLYSGIVILGLIFFVVPGVYFAIKYFFYLLFIVDKEVGIRRAFENSAEITQGAKLKLLLLLSVLSLINLGGALLLGVGLFLTIPATMLSLVYVYRKLFELPMVMHKEI